MPKPHPHLPKRPTITDLALPRAPRWQTIPPIGRALIGFWAAIGCLAVVGAAALIWLPTPPAAVTHDHTSSHPTDAPHPPVPAIAPRATAITGMPPEDAVRETIDGDPGHFLPVMGPNAEMAAHLFAATAPVADARPRVAILLSGVGYDLGLTKQAIEQVSPMVSLAISPYAPLPGPIVTAARAAHHEIFLSLPMQPSAAPADDEGPRALGYGNSARQNQDNLHWALSRLSEYVGVTSAMSGMSGDEFGLSPDFRPIARELHERGLLYLNATPGHTPDPAAANADITMITSADAGSIDAQLAQLATIAKIQGHAIAVAGPLTPVLLQRVAAWIATLQQDGIVLVPVSALSPMPARPPQPDTLHDD